MAKAQETTTTLLVEEALKRADDFMTSAQLQTATGRNTSQVSAALHHLRKVKVVDVMEADDTLWWYATPEDLRSKRVEERTIEPEGSRKPRKSGHKGRRTKHEIAMGVNKE